MPEAPGGERLNLTTWLSVAAVCALGAMSPGPSLAVVVRNTLGNSRVHGLATAWAHASGIGFYALLTTLGLAVVVERYRPLYLALAVLGALYLVYLGVGALRAGGTVRLEPGERRHRAVAGAAREGFFIAFLNPKIAVFFLAVFSQFIHRGMSLGQHLGLSGTAAVIDGLWYSLVAVALSRGRWAGWLRRRAAWIDRATGVVLILVAAAGLGRLAL